MAEINHERLPTEREAYSDDDSDDNSLFRYIGDQGDGTASRLCAYCWWMLDNWDLHEKDPYFTYPHHSNISQLREAVGAGCALCQQFLNSRRVIHRIDGIKERATGIYVNEYMSIRPDDPDQSSTVTLELRLNSDDYQPFDDEEHEYVKERQDQTLQSQDDQDSRREADKNFANDDDNYSSDNEDIDGGDSDNDDDGDGYDEDVDEDDKDDSQNSDEINRFVFVFYVDMSPTKHPVLVNLSSHTRTSSTGDSLNLAERWLRRCQKSHWKCTNSIGNFTPTRLICLSGNILRLCLAKDISRPIQYTTLSHCWGMTKSATLSTRNMALFQEQIPDDALSQTIIDAIHTARHLGFSYLWVDTLCIIQDDRLDWARESSSMSSVYGSSYLNIAASGAVDGSVGCFFDRQHPGICQTEVKIRGIPTRYDFVAYPFTFQHLLRMPLMQRAWAFQERLLPARTLHFTKTEVFWECFHKLSCESFPEGIPWRSVFTIGHLAKQPLAPSMWKLIVDNYSLCNLTFPKDKLVAIAGLAQRIQTQTKDQYVAGLWRNDLAFQLCWITDEALPSRPSESYIAPSWSWASIGSSIELFDMEKIGKSDETVLLWITIIDVTLRNFPQTDPFGALVDAKLRLSCRLLMQVQVIRDTAGAAHSLEYGAERAPCFIYFDIEEHEREERRSDVYVLPVFETISNQDITGLLLEPAGNRKGIYRRVGRFSTWNKEYGTGFERMVASYAQKVKLEDCYEVRLDRSGNPCHIIHLI